MSALDEAIREHLELKRQHGAGDNELRELEDQAFGPPARPGDAASDAPMDEASAAVEDEAPPAVTEPEAEPVEPFPESAAPPAAEPVEAVEEPVELPAEPPAEEEHPAMEHATVDPDAADAGTVAAETEEHPPPEPPEEPEAAEQSEEASIADQPTELYDFGGGPVGEEAKEAVEEEHPEGEEAVEDEFFSEQSLSDELDQALDAPETEQAPPPPDVAEAPEPDSREEELPAEEE
ncbi:MAG TPA: hypothetical protein VIL53_00840, partial [Solirubrobacterales bacterium]